MTTAYFDCFSGISGDMILGALVSLGVPADWLQSELSRLPLDGFQLRSRGVSRHGIQAVHVEVVIQETHHHRTYRSIRELVDGCPLSAWVKSKSLEIFDRIATAEAAVHGIAKEEVHFHEVGSMDAIVDVVGACLGFEYLKIENVIASALPLGKGFVQCQHGTLPVPAPATLEILKGVPVHSGPVAQEMVTPTGAGIITAMASSFGAMPAMQIDGIGYGAGTRELEQQPNLLRVIIGRPVARPANLKVQELVMVECNIDDMNPELFGYLMEKLLADGALDVVWIPIYMKKNRPGTLVQVLCNPETKSRVVERILNETTSLGVRFYEVQRTCLDREAVRIATPWGEVDAKQVTGLDGRQRVVPEFEACRRIAEARGVALRTVYTAVLAAGQTKL